MTHFKHLILSVLLTLAAIVTASAQDGAYFSAANKDGVNIVYKVDSQADLRCAVTQSKYAGVVCIPASVEYNGSTYAVARIAGGAFYECTDLEAVELPSSITSIGDGSFYNCTGLKSLEIPSQVTSIGAGAFANCQNLSELTVQIKSPDNVFWETGLSMPLY